MPGHILFGHFFALPPKTPLNRCQSAIGSPQPFPFRESNPGRRSGPCPSVCIVHTFAYMHLLHGYTYYMDTPTTWIHLLHGCTYYMDAPTTWMHLLHGCTYYMDALTTWMHLLHGCTYYMDAPTTWMHLLHGCTRKTVKKCLINRY